jgi:GAF domain-containing protein
MTGSDVGLSTSSVDELATVYARMSGLLLSDETVDSAVRLVTSLTADTVPGLGVGISLLDGAGQRETTGASDELVERADDLQYELGEGPCLAAWASRVLVRIDDVATDRRWPRWGSAVERLGVRGCMSAPLVAGDNALGAMKIYADRPGAFDAHAERRLTMFAAQAAVLLANSRSLDATRRYSEELVEALRVRDVISTAKGIVMAKESVGEDAAIALLTARAQRSSRSLRETALGVVRSTVRLRR